MRPGPPPCHGRYNLIVRNVIHLNVRVVFVGAFGINVIFEGEGMATRLRREDIALHELLP